MSPARVMVGHLQIPLGRYLLSDLFCRPPYQRAARVVYLNIHAIYELLELFRTGGKLLYILLVL
ncbi:MAG: hypothetical protein U9N48_00995 [Euryarchaeota archaeon]|nr:hypothetical protein [Euryarchaeota archaeon]